ncbi:MAG TPA: ABC transporter ATP-binding protein [Candidatus Mediterraneibacter pullistercoris]|nr:ABC transporter ATP-binding protein [Candidatus Mediterraneibacter pullistercoris]
MKPILQIKHLSVYFTQYEQDRRFFSFQKRRIAAVKDLSLEIQPGQITAVVGASGSGKSLLAHSILGILPYNSHMEGEIRYDGEPLTEKRAKKLRGNEIFLIPQGVTYLDPLMKVGEQLRKGKKDPNTKQCCRMALERYGLGADVEEMYPFELSGGMARRVLIASAVTERPRLIIADEPTPGLDARAAKRILSHFRELADEGAGMLFITHDLELALSVADEVVVFYAGETIEKAKAKDFSDAANLRHPYTRALWHAMPEHGFRASEGTQPYAGNVRKGCPYAGQCSVCRELCRTKEQIPLIQYRSGEVRCLYPDEMR